MANASAAEHGLEPNLPQTELPAAKVALWWFLASEIMVFGGFIATYVLFRAANDGAWAALAAHLSTPLAAFNTLILLTSSLTVVKALDGAHRADHAALRKYLLLTIILGVGFLCVKGVEYSIEITHGFTPLSGMFWAFYYTMTGLHGLHVLAGIVIHVVLLVSVSRQGAQFTGARRVEAGALYWHFVDVVWVFLFPLLYLSY